MKKTIGYLGPEGSFSHEVTSFLGTVYGGKCKLLALEPSKFAHALKHVEVWKVVLPIFNAIGILMEKGMHCFGCAMASGETLEQGCLAHGINPDKIINEINKLEKRK